MKKLRAVLITVLAILMLLVVVPILVLKFAFPEAKLRALVLPRASAALGRTVDCERIGLGLGWRGAQLELDAVSLGPAEENPLRSLELPALRAELAWGPLLHRELDVKSLRLEGLRARVVLPAAEEAPGAASGAGAPGAASSVAPGGAESLAPAALAVAAPDVRLSNAEIVLVKPDAFSVTVGVPEARFASNMTRAGALDLTATLRLDPIRVEGAPVALTADASVDLDLGLAGQTLTLRHCRVEMPGLSAAPVAGGAWRMSGQGPVLQLAGTASLAAAAAEAAPAASLGLAIDLELRPLDVETSALTAPLRVAGGRLAGDLSRLAVSDLRVEAGESALALAGTITPLPEPRMGLTLRGDRLDLDALLPDSTAKAKAPAPAGEPGPVLPPVALPGTVDFHLGAVVLRGATIEDLRGRLVIDAEGLRLEDLGLRLFEGAAAGHLAVTPAPAGAARCRGAFMVEGVRAPAFLRTFTPVKRGVEGVLGSELELDMLLVPGADKPRGLDVDARVDLADAALVGLSALRAVGQVAGLAVPERWDLGRVRQQVKVRDDKVITENLRLPLQGGHVLGSGTTGLNGVLDWRGTLHLDPAGAARLGSGSVLQVLKEPDGSLDVAFTLTGTLREPQVTLDQAAIRAKLREKAETELKDKGDELLQKGLDELKKRFR